jgi:lipopolysaccharide/colanic/teichoic acid biosynthesis glycosyltransferase
MSQQLNITALKELDPQAIGPVVQDRNSYFQIKRILDLILAISALILLSPLMSLIALMVVIDSPGPAIIVQIRIGARQCFRDGHAFWQQVSFPFFKFRTMWVDANPLVHQQFIDAYIAGDEAEMAKIQTDPESQTKHKLVNDPRVTRVGKILRKTSLDELPQIWNVIKGEMSLVGPRPPLPYEVEKYHLWHFQRLTTLPGITGLWQVSGRSSTSFDEMVSLDLKYIENQSIWRDIKILIKTIPAVLSGKGAE